MEALLFFMASITAGVWCSYYLEYREDKKIRNGVKRKVVL